MLAFNDSNTFRPWTGEPVNDIRHPLSVEELWSDAELNAAGLYRVQVFNVPQGKTISGPASYTLSGTVVVETYPVADPTPVQPTKDDVVRERDRRLAFGFNYDFKDARSVHRIGTTVKDMAGWEEVTTISNAAINTGAPGLTIHIDTDTGPCTVTASEWQQVLLAAGQFRQPIWQAYFGLIAVTPTPSDYAADIRWPSET